jgi:molybdenum cofactor cytidylyltransferase
LKGVPKDARIIPFLNKVETADQLTAARQIAKLTLHSSRIAQVLIGAVQSDKPIREVHKRVTAVVLAAGAANRMGQTKQLLPWGDTTVLGQVLRNVKETAVHDCLIVTGHEAEKVASVAAAEGVPTVFNPQFAFGDMLSSLQTAVRHLQGETEAVLVVLADQPFVEATTMNLLLEAFWQRQGQLIAPTYDGQRGNPVLIGRPFFQELLTLPYNAVPRQLLQRHGDTLHLVPINSATILRDLDNKQDYARWRPNGTKKAAPENT